MNVFTSFALIISMIMSVFGGSYKSEAFVPERFFGLKLNFTVLADTHVSDRDYTIGRDCLIAGVKDINSGTADSDALVIAGDFTCDGSDADYNTLSRILSECKSNNIVISAGNHEFALVGDKVDPAKFSVYGKRFIGFRSRYIQGSDKVYYSTVIKGYRFIMLGSESTADFREYISPEQLSFVDRSLTEAAKDGKPVFVVNHYPFNHTNKVIEYQYYSRMGDQSDALNAILKRHSEKIKIFYFSGHIHNAIDISGITHDGSLYYVDLPSFGMVPHDWGEAKAESCVEGIGYQVEVYKREVAFRARNYITGKWMKDYDVTVKL